GCPGAPRRFGAGRGVRAGFCAFSGYIEASGQFTGESVWVFDGFSSREWTAACRTWPAERRGGRQGRTPAVAPGPARRPSRATWDVSPEPDICGPASVSPGGCGEVLPDVWKRSRRGFACPGLSRRVRATCIQWHSESWHNQDLLVLVHLSKG